jgi:hypothetical protein
MRVSAVLIVLLVVACHGERTSGPAPHASAGPAALTKRKFERYAFEAYPSWAAAHPGKNCPDKLSDLNGYMDSNDVSDAWGRPIKMLCGTNVPIDRRAMVFVRKDGKAGGIAFLSAGEDGMEGTDDDVKSWEPFE